MTSRSSSFLRYFKWLYLALVAAILVYLMVKAGKAQLDWARWLSSAGVYVFCAGWIIMVTILGKAWSVGLHQLSGVELPIGTWFPAQTSAWAGRYLPGKVGLFAGKLTLLKSSGISTGVLSLSVLYEQFAFVLVGMLVLLASPVALPNYLPGLDTWLAPLRHPLGLLGLGGAILAGMGLVRRLLHLQYRSTFGLWLGRSVRVFSLHACAHIVVGIGFHGLVLELAEGPSIPSLGYSIGVVALAHAAGALAFFAPAGLGVREAVLTAALAPYMPLQAALLLATVTRIATLLADAGLFATGRLLSRSA